MCVYWQSSAAFPLSHETREKWIFPVAREGNTNKYLLHLYNVLKLTNCSHIPCNP